MSLSAVMGISLSGMQAQQTRLAATANNIANVSTPGYNRLETKFSSVEGGGVRASVEPSGGAISAEASNVDLTTEILSVMTAETAFKANAAVWETGADMWDMLKTIVRD
ncbi:flagellar basal body rod protein FlgC [Rhizobium sp. AAP43]|uniref:flagellar basal body rod protein FlgC n=1 Tax=Rhizobium sp. AAP43 TaxID=1523420 RepID=UPI0006B8AFB0|nr:flagellar basal body protein [Rhizobium sp. AAP43]KPF41770.1 flagellar basal body rod protein [Rhizobium sp. AAP43]